MQDEPLQTIKQESQCRDEEGCPCSRVCHPQPWLGFSLRVSSLQPCSRAPTEREGRRSQAGSSVVGQIIRFGLCPTPSWKGKTFAWPPLGTSPGHGDCSHGVQRTQVARPSCRPTLIQLNIPGSGDVIPKPHGAARCKGRAGSCGQRRAQGSPDVHHRGRWVSTYGDL